MLRLMKHWFFGGLVLLAGAVAQGCGDQKYRTEVYTGQQGTYSIQRVPVEPAPREESAPQPPIDPDLNEVAILWPRLSPADRQTVVDLVRRLAGP